MRPERVQNNFEFLKSLNNLKTGIPEFIRGANDDQLLTLVEIAFNLIKFSYTPTPKQLKSLYPFAAIIRQLARTRSRRRAQQILTSQPHQFYYRLLQPLILQ
jgi:hypothetical protein